MSSHCQDANNLSQLVPRVVLDRDYCTHQNWKSLPSKRLEIYLEICIKSEFTFNFSKSGSNDCKICVERAKEHQQRDVDEEIVTETILKLDEELLNQTAVLKHLLNILGLDCDLDTRHQGVLGEQKEGIIEDKNAKV